MQYPIDNENEVVETEHNENEVVKTEPVKVTLANTKEETVAPYTIAEQVAFDLTNVASPLSKEVPDNVQGALVVALEGALVAMTASNKADAASCMAAAASSAAAATRNKAEAAYAQASSAYSLANNAYIQADNAYDLANSAYGFASSASQDAGWAYGKANNAYDLASTNSEYLSDVKVIFKALAGTMYNGDGEGMGSIYGGNPTIPDLGTEIGQAYDQANTAYSLGNGAYFIAGSIYNRESGKAADGYNAGTYLLKATIDSSGNIEFTWVNEADYKNVQNS